ncbi:hypothetical protein ACWV26_10445 [Rummeliibacillus sp. JY-2-4R]
MDSTNSTVELVVQQSENVLLSMKDLKNGAKKKGKARSDLYERFCANIHSFSIYTIIDPEIEESKEVTDFHDCLDQFREYFKDVTTDYESIVDIKSAQTAYEKVFPVYNTMVSKLGFPDREVNAKRF